MDFKNLRKQYPEFIYENYSWELNKGNLKISFNFKIKPDLEFAPEIQIKNIPKTRIKKEALNNLVFHLGLIELLSYWKATCSPKIIIKAGSLSREQIKWWKGLILKGMGQFFYENKINFRTSNFLKIHSLQESLGRPVLRKFKDRVLVPIGGGKDSIVTLEILKKTGKKINCFSLNPTDVNKKVMQIGGCKNPIIVRRKIDKRLLELNKKGFLNGHTPFSAYLAFLSVLLGLIFDYKYIAFSNERSSNEGNIKYLGRIINHQYSKSFEFEKKFREYSKKYLAKNIEYFSFLRPLYEIQISKLFSQFSKYFATFLSCNDAFKTNSDRKKPTEKWCGKCPKCLFVFTSLYPFVEEKKLIKIFEKNLFKDKKLIPLTEKLIGERGFKPFECVGTKKESQIAFYLSCKKWGDPISPKAPLLLRYFENKILPKYKNLERKSQRILSAWSNQHFLPKDFKKILKNTL